MSNPYDILGVEKSASDDEVKKAFRKAAHKHHPDKDGGDEAKFKEVNEAYQTLSDKNKRAQYDQYGQTFDGAGGGGGGQGFGGFDFSQFTDQQGGGFDFDFGGAGDVFGDMFGGGRGRSRGQDMQVAVEISFAEMITGVKKSVTLRKSVLCDHCDGKGGEPGSGEHKCTTCDGHGVVEKVVRTMLGNIAQRVVCEGCNGKGQKWEQTCESCTGHGTQTKEVTEDIEIPAGINHGQTIAVTGKGEAGANGAPAGDLLVVIKVAGDKQFTRDGNNVISDVHVSFAQAALGDKVDVQTVEGEMTMKVPAGTQSGEVFRIKNKGVPRLQSIGRGDHLVTVIVDVPKKLSKEEKKLIEQLNKL